MGHSQVRFSSAYKLQWYKHIYIYTDYCDSLAHLTKLCSIGRANGLPALLVELLDFSALLVS